MGRLYSLIVLAALFVCAAGRAVSLTPKAHRHSYAKTAGHAKAHSAAARTHPKTHLAAHSASHPAKYSTHGAHRRATIYRHSAIRRVRATPHSAHLIPAPEPEVAEPLAGPAAESASAPRTDAATESMTETMTEATTEPSLSATESAAPAASSLREPAPQSLRIPKAYVPPLFGSRESLVRQNEKVEAEGLERIEDSDDLNDRIARGLLVPVPVSSALSVNPSLPEDLRYCRPWTADFLTELAKAHDQLFHRPLTVSSAVRTVEYQKHLERVNGNAAPAEGDVVSPHLTGGTVDIGKAGLPRSELAWMRAWLKPLQEAGQIDVEEEFHQSCFHITVYQSYGPPPMPPSVAAARKPAPKPRHHHTAVANALAAKSL